MNNQERKGKTYEEIYGIEKAEIIKKKLSEKRKGKTHIEIFGKDKAEKWLKNRKGKSMEDLYGKEKAEKMKKILSEHRKKRNHLRKNKTYEELYGKEKAKEIKIKISNTINKNCKLKGMNYNERYGKEKAEIIKRKLSKQNKGISLEKKYGKEKANRIKQQIIERNKKNIKWKPKDLIRRINEIFKEYGPMTKSALNRRKKELNFCDNATLWTIFGSTDKFAAYAGIEFKKTDCRKGSDEDFIIDCIKKQEGIKVIQQYYIAGKYIDAYDPINNVAYEVDEPYHKKQSAQDFLREQQIKEKIKCKFIRIDAQKFLN